MTSVDAPLDRILKSLQELYPEKIDLSLDRLFRLLDKLGNPQDKTPPVIHVAGTNGKGSTIAYMRAITEVAGYKCHVYTSPHLLRFNERIRLAGHLASDEFLIDILQEVKAVNKGAAISFFEVTTAAAFVAFSRVPADVLLLEVGMGGLRDATNVVRDPLLTVITTISYDHCDWLGRTLPEIAIQKAGIMRMDVPCVVGCQMPWAREEVVPALQGCATRARTSLILCGRDWSVTPGESLRMDFQGRRYRYPAPNLLGVHQFWNAGAAITALKSQSHLNISEEAFAGGVQKAEWPGRLEHIVRGRVAEALPAGWELWYDGAHNDSCGEVLAHQVAAWSRAEPDRPLHVVTAMLRSKDPAVCLGPLLPYVNSVSTFSFVNGPYDQTGPVFSADDLAASLRPVCAGVKSYHSLEAAVAAVAERSSAGRVLVTGTLYAYKELV
ncbi:MAG: bifunctional folylpolyglutamate synthase/dihydrofolate synthase [Micavibrio aeruginosavorus]|uniref:tetrahydrofolate synthase n=1 Tax=Micavibrio aeruginosavorus TaxID=349221 RepID=A0A7T5R496_9BACT|nr:MAG: bifunctional folylpolyglutamate synthase/dihydrofolate synthase [Micavibrio aeruginosavorus]